MNKIVAHAQMRIKENKVVWLIFGFSLLFIVSCTGRKNLNPNSISEVDSIAITDSMHPDSFHYPSPSEFNKDHMPPPPPLDSKHFDGPPPPPPHGKGRPPHKPDNMRGFDPASENDMEDNGMSRYMENNDDEGWD